MVRLLGVVIKDDYKIAYALTKIYGIGWPTAYKVVDQSGVDMARKIGDISEEELKKITQLIDKNYKVEGNLREEINENLKRLREIRSYRGMRHAFGLPSRGQRTRSNARTKRGKRKTVGALRKEAWAKLEQQKK
jgi:small subunit ribosomal protein S13